MAELPINYGDTGKVARDKINESYNALLEQVEWYEPHIVDWIWWIWETNTWVKAEWDHVQMKVEWDYIRYKTDSISWTTLILLSDLKGEKGDTGDKWDAFVYSDFTEEQLAALTWPQGAKWDKGDKWDKWDKGERWDTGIMWPEGKQGKQWIQWEKGDKWDKWDKWDKGDQWDKGDKGDTGNTWPTWPSIVSAAFSGNDIVFTKDDSNTVTLDDAKIELKWDQWEQGEQGVQWETWPTWNWIASITSSKSGKVTTVTITETSGDSDSFEISDWQDGEWSGDVLWPNSSVDWNVVLFDWTSGKYIKDSTKPFTPAWIGALPSTTKYWASITVSINTTDYKMTTTLKDQDGNTLGTAQVIDLPLESVVVNGSYDSTNKKIILTLQSGSTIEFSVADLVSWLQSEITSSNKLDADLVDDSTSTNKFVTASDKTTWNWKQDKLVAWTNITIAADWKTISSTDTTYSAASSSSLWLVKLWSDTVQSVAANAVTGAASRTYAMQVNSSWQLVVNIPRTDTTYTASSFDIKDLADSTGLRTTWSGKQDALTTQTAYTEKGTTTKVPQITTNTLWQVTTITEKNIAFPVTSVNGSTWAVTVSEFSPWAWTTGQVVTKTNDWYWYANIPSQVDDTTYGSSWDWVTGTAPSKNAVYDAIESKLWDIETLLAAL